MAIPIGVFPLFDPANAAGIGGLSLVGWFVGAAVLGGDDGPTRGGCPASILSLAQVSAPESTYTGILDGGCHG